MNPVGGDRKFEEGEGEATNELDLGEGEIYGEPMPTEITHNEVPTSPVESTQLETILASNVGEALSTEITETTHAPLNEVVSEQPVEVGRIKSPLPRALAKGKGKGNLSSPNVQSRGSLGFLGKNGEG
jgi:hypothetical protein